MKGKQEEVRKRGEGTSTTDVLTDDVFDTPSRNVNSPLSFVIHGNLIVTSKSYRYT